MSWAYRTGFEWQSLVAGVEYTEVIGSPTIDTTIKRSGASSLHVGGSIPTGEYWGWDHNITALATGWYRWGFYIDNQNDDANVATTFDLFLTAANAITCQIVRSGAAYTAEVFINDYATSLGTFSAGIDGWHVLEIYYDTSPANGSEKVTVRYDGADQITRTDLTLTSKTINNIQLGVYNGTAGAITGTDVYFDDIGINNSSGSVNNSWCGLGKIVMALPTGAGDNAATTGIYSYINEVPPSNTATSGSTMIELDTNGTIGDYNVTDSSTLGIDSHDTIVGIQVMARVREENTTGAPSAYTLRIKSASGGTVAATGSVDAGNATARTNPSATTAFGNMLISETDPTTGVAWTPTGTNSIDNMQIGGASQDDTPDVWILAMAAMIEYTEGSPPGGSVVKDIIGGFGIIPFAR